MSIFLFVLPSYLNVVPMVAKQIVRERSGEERVAHMHRDDVRRGVLHRHLGVCLARQLLAKSFKEYKRVFN